MKKEQKESQEERCPSYNAISHSQMGVQVPIVLIFSSMIFNLEKPLNQKMHTKSTVTVYPISLFQCVYAVVQ